MGVLDDHNLYPTLPGQSDAEARPGIAAILAIVFALLWLYGIGSLFGVLIGVYARLHVEDDGWPKVVATVAVALGAVGLAVALWLGLTMD